MPPEQQELFPPVKPAPTVAAQSASPKPRRRLNPTLFFLAVALRMNVGLWIAILPWTRFWDGNPILLMSRDVYEVATLGAVRGVVSGLGLLNIWIAFRDALRS